MAKETYIKQIEKEEAEMIAALEKQIEAVRLAATIEKERVNRGIDRLPYSIADVMRIRDTKVKHLDDPSAYAAMVSHMDGDFNIVGNE